MNRTEQKDKRRQDILNAGLDLFIRKGYAATRTADIAKAIGMSEGLLFRYFATKEKLYLTLLEIAASGKNIILELKNDSPLNFFQKTAETILDYISREPFGAKIFVLMNKAQYDEALSEEVRANLMRKKDIENSIGIIQKGQQDGSIRQGDPLALTIAFFMSIQGIAENIARNPHMPVPKAEWIADILRSK